MAVSPRGDLAGGRARGSETWCFAVLLIADAQQRRINCKKMLLAINVDFCYNIAHKEVSTRMKNQNYRMNSTVFEAYEQCLLEEEKSAATIEKYCRDIKAFYRFLPEVKHVTKESVIAYKASIMSRYSPISVNSMLAALNHFFKFVGCPDLCVRSLKLQRRSFSEPEQELTLEEYHRLLDTAVRQKKEQLFLVMETICATGIRVSELEFITVEAVRAGRAFVNCKGKERIIFLPEKLTKKLLRYADTAHIQKGYLFMGKRGTPLSRTQIWSAMKGLCAAANVPQSKVYPHNLRHLFARRFYQMEKDLVRLADVLGHSDVNTTRIYTRESGRLHERQVAKLGLVT